MVKFTELGVDHGVVVELALHDLNRLQPVAGNADADKLQPEGRRWITHQGRYLDDNPQGRKAEGMKDREFTLTPPKTIDILFPTA